MVSPSQIARNLHALGVRPGDSVLTHSSYKAVAGDEGVEGGPAGVVQGLVEAVGPEGCALFPAHAWLGAGTKSPPQVDMATTEPRAVGAIPIAAFHRGGGVRSCHPTHSLVAIGGLATWMTEAHHEEQAGICGRESPYERLTRPPSGRGWILLLGVDHERNTSLHMLEELVQVPRTITKAVPVVIGRGTLEPDTRMSRFHQNHWRRFQVLDPLFDAEGIQIRGRVGHAEVRLVDAARQRERVTHLLMRDRTLLFARSRSNRAGTLS